MYDVIVVGARCAGSPTAMLLARQGRRVLLLDSADFPSDTMSTHHVHRPGLELLREWGLLDRLLDTGCPPVTRIVYQVEGVRLEGGVLPSEGISATYAPRRRVLDQLLVEAAVEAGAEFRPRSRVTGLLWDGDRVVGVRHRSADGGTEEVRARLVVGADGMRSTVARRAGAVMETEDPTLNCAYYTYWEGVTGDLELYHRSSRFVGAMPTHDGAALVVCYFPQEQYDEVRRDSLAFYLESVRTTAPELWERMSGSRRTERLWGTGAQLNFFREPYGEGWALIGDAGHHKDSMTGTGISDALEQADLLARLVGPHLRDDAKLGSALEEFAVERRRLLDPRYAVTLESARLSQAYERMEELRWISQDPDSTNLFLAIALWMVRQEDLPEWMRERTDGGGEHR
ncbi:NAD(P)/FAD-dependent oxidoreductase [Nocardiopsis kunsanensis]|uniref:NAD(P)/FAD-dependent oxidoreductase n=1 Tax=Nocardiopsis kunsanensis TaxID=141693 RepID=UPI0003470C28|nr:NAD(P)/FAD-dependent oxidoreductase [Nocardiopsis kunsanensis]